MKIPNALKWSFLGQVSYFILYFTFNVILSRILNPADFGVYAIVNTFIVFFSLIKDFGLGSYLVRSKILTKKLCDTVFYFNLIFSIFLFLIILVATPFIASFYKDDRLIRLIRLCALTFIIDAICTIPHAMLVRNMDFKRLFMIRVTSISVAGFLAILLALSGWGIYSLIIQAIIISMISSFILFYFFPYLPGCHF